MIPTIISMLRTISNPFEQRNPEQTREPEDWATQGEGPELGVVLMWHAPKCTLHAHGEFVDSHWCNPQFCYRVGFRVSPDWRWGDGLVLNGKFYDGRDKK